MTVLVLAGIGVSAYLSYAYLWQQAIICGESLGCDLVAQSAYSRMFGIPIAVFGLLTYIVLFGLLVARQRINENLEAYVPLAMFGIAIVSVLFSAYLTYLELFVILAVCKWCAAQAAIIVAFLILSLFELRSTAL
jgi:uncharacterized membrane protein